MREVIVGIVCEIKALEQRLQAVKGDFELFIADKSIPLSERWQVWEDAPETLKNTGGWCSDGRLERKVEQLQANQLSMTTNTNQQVQAQAQPQCFLPPDAPLMMDPKFYCGGFSQGGK